MARNLTAVKVIIGLNPDTGQAQYPNFNLISATIRKNMDWSKYIDVHGDGWHYDKTSGHKDDSAESAFGQQEGCLCVPADFAAAAISMFPGICSAMTPAEFETFHDTKAHRHEEDDTMDVNALTGLKARRQLLADTGGNLSAIDIKIARALNPNNKAAGVRKNNNKKWTDARSARGINLT